MIRQTRLADVANQMGPGELGEWDALSIAQVAALLGGAPFPWWIAGGWAIDLAIGRATRPHGDVEVAVLRKDQLSLREWLRGWQLWFVPAPGGGLIRWTTSAALAPEVHELWCRGGDDGPWQLEVLFEESADGRWMYRRDGRISLPISEFGTTIDGVPVVRPEVALLYKSKRPRERDEADLLAALPALHDRSRAWLADALDRTGAPATWTAHLRREDGGTR